MTENAHFLPIGDERLFAFHHRPAGDGGRGVVLCAPFAEEKLWSHRVLVSFARALAARGWHVLRFDHRGEGDSDRDFAASDLASRIADIDAAIDGLRRLAPGGTAVTLVGLRLGATLAAAAAARRDDVDRLVLWDPVTNGEDYMQSVLRINLMAQMAQHHKVIEGREALVERLERGGTVNVEGYELTRALFEGVSSLRLGELLDRRPRPALALSIAPRPAPPRPDLAALAEGRPALRVEAVAEEAFWKEIRAFCPRAGALFDASVAWMEGAP